MKRFLSVLLLTAAGLLAQTVVTYTSSTSWTAPAGVTSVKVEVWGGGGAGGSCWNAGSLCHAGGGGGGAYARKNALTVTPGNSYTVTVGARGTASLYGGTSGGDSWFGSTPTVIAKGGLVGAGGGSGLWPGGTGGGTGSVGDQVWNGGYGAEGTYFYAPYGGGGGGSGAGSTGYGNAGYYSTGGAAKFEYGGAGGNGNGNAAGSPGNNYGGGGGGGATDSGGDSVGGHGAPGFVRLTYTIPGGARLIVVTDSE